MLSRLVDGVAIFINKLGIIIIIIDYLAIQIYNKDNLIYMIRRTINMKNHDEYIPQFADFNISNTENSGKCLLCGEHSYHIDDGMCPRCLKKTETIENITSRKKPNYNVYKQFIKKANIIKAHSVSGLIVFPLFKYGYASLWFSLSATIIIGLLIYGESFDLGGIIFLSVLVAIFLCLGILHIQNKNKKDYEDFDKYNDMNIKTFNKSSWICPCCNSVNEKISSCETCGVFPKLDIEK